MCWHIRDTFLIFRASRISDRLLVSEEQFAEGTDRLLKRLSCPSPAMSDPAGRRQSGVLIPLFSCPSSRSWGVATSATSCR